MEYTEAKVKDIFVDFLKSYKDDRGELKYRIQVSQLPSKGGKSIIVDYPDLLSYNIDLATSLIREPDSFLKSFDDASVETLSIENPVYADRIRKEMHVRIRELTDRLSLRGVTKSHLNTMILVAGMVTRTSELRPLAVSAAFRCPNKHLTYVEQTGVILKRPVKCETEGCGETKNFELDEMKTEFIDFQVIKIQEMPEELPPGQLPQSFDVHLTGDVVNSARPGDRIVLTGVVKAEPEYAGGAARLRLFSTRIMANFVEQLGKRPEETEISREEEEKIRALAAMPGAYDRLVSSVAPAIFGHELHKEAALLLMVGSPQKNLPDGSSLRGDINVLLVGDPGCLVADERIVLGNGTIAKIGDIGSSHLQELNMQVLTGEGGGKRAVATTYHIYEEQPVIEIITESGKSVKGTFNHPILARVNEYGSREKEWRRLDQIRVGDKVAVATFLPCTVTAPVKTNFQQYPGKSKYGPAFKGKLPKFVTEELGAFCGYVLGDGWVRKTGEQVGFVVAETDRDILPKLLTIAESLFGLRPSVRRRIAKGRKVPLHYATIDSKDVAWNLAFLQSKRVPEMILRSGNKVLAEFLKWLFEADGCVFPLRRGIGDVSLKAKDVELLRDVQILLLRFGIHSRIIGNALRIRRGSQIVKFSREIGFASARKNKILKELVKKPGEKRTFHGQRLERVVRIVRHEKPQRVYDIEVPNGHRFIANGLISHNTAKSELLKYVSRIAPRGLFTSGRGSTAAGLTAAVVKEKNGMMMLEAGATVLADLGVACIDEFDKMRDEDRSALHEVMEQQTASVAKGGIIATLNARTSILAAANPVDGKYDPYKNILDNVALPVPLLTRFDLVFILRDEADPSKDETIARHILDMRAKSTFPTQPPVDFELLKKYIIYAKKIEPELTEEARNRLSAFYIKLRREASPDQISVTPRWLEGLIRLAIARARILLHPRVTEDDALHAINLVERMLNTVAVDQATKKVDIGVLYNKPLSEKGLREAALEVFKKLSGESKQPVENKAFYEEMEKTGKFSREQAEKVFQDMWKSGVIYEVKPNFFKKA
ncbi:MAG: hypothetical protein JRN52_09635 [Nitrososphaerota archaeon]|nr:hypothetical protein [Nitrososphaerota archaeon]